MVRCAEKEPAVYILASRVNGTLYVGVTSDLYSRMMQHREGTFDGFTKVYGVKTLVYFEFHQTMEAAIRRESQIKKWKRIWKIRLILEMNPTWSDLFDQDQGLKDVGSGGIGSCAAVQNETISGLFGRPPSRP